MIFFLLGGVGGVNYIINKKNKVLNQKVSREKNPPKCQTAIFRKSFENSYFSVNRKSVIRMNFKIKPGRPRKIKSVEELINFWNKYVDAINSDDNKWKLIDFRGKDAKRVEVPHTVPMTKIGFANFCNCHKWEVLSDLKKTTKEFSEVITHIERLIYQHKFTGASVGAFNSSIIASDLGLKNRTENTNKTELNISVSDGLDKKLDDLISD